LLGVTEVRQKYEIGGLAVRSFELET